MKKQKMDFDAQQPSSSSSLSNVEGIEKVVLNNLSKTNTHGPLALDKMEQEKNLQSDSQSENQDDKCLIEELPTEMLMKILKCLDVMSLAGSRLVSRRWNGMAREIIKSRDDVETVFTCRQTEDGTFKLCGRTERATLENFIKCFEDSKDSPLYTRFRFENIESSIFECEDWIKFISEFGKGVKCLKLNFYCKDGVQSVEGLRHLLLNQLPNLSEFGIQIKNKRFEIPSKKQRLDKMLLLNIRLFPMRTTASNENEETRAASTVQLPNLKVLYLDEDCFSEYTGIVTDLLLAAVNLQKIKPFVKYDFHSRFATFHFLQSFEKLHCLQCISLDAYFVSEIQGQSSMPFKLKNMRLHAYEILNSPAFWSDAAVFLSNLFESSKDTFKHVSITPMGFLPNLQLPKFSKTTSLLIDSLDKKDLQIQVFPSGLDLNEIFPVLQKIGLGVPWTNLFPRHENQHFCCLPNLKILEITGDKMRKEDIVQISQVCPNLKKLEIDRSMYGRAVENFPQVGTAIWTHLTQLESLDVKIDADSRANALNAVESCFTGFTRKKCIWLHSLIKNGQSSENPGSQIKSKTQVDEAERKNPSILDLKDLRNLTVTFAKGRWEDEETPVLANETLIISEKYAFKLMENLNYKIN